MLVFPCVWQVAKIRSELDVVERNASVFHEMIQVFVPGDEATADYDLFMVSGCLNCSVDVLVYCCCILGSRF